VIGATALFTAPAVPVFIAGALVVVGVRAASQARFDSSLIKLSSLTDVG
jgi:hypothetical protein